MRKLFSERLCNCQRSISGADDELFGEVLAHLSRDHPAMPLFGGADTGVRHYQGLQLGENIDERGLQEQLATVPG